MKVCPAIFSQETSLSTNKSQSSTPASMEAQGWTSLLWKLLWKMVCRQRRVWGGHNGSPSPSTQLHACWVASVAAATLLAIPHHTISHNTVCLPSAHQTHESQALGFHELQYEITLVWALPFPVATEFGNADGPSFRKVLFRSVLWEARLAWFKSVPNRSFESPPIIFFVGSKSWLRNPPPFLRLFRLFGQLRRAIRIDGDFKSCDSQFKLYG